MWAMYHLFIVLVCPHILMADTDITSKVTGQMTLTLDRSPYIASEGLIIHEGGILEVEAGVTVKFAPGHGLGVHGNLTLKGTQTNKVTFTLWSDAEIDPTVTNRSDTIRLTGDAEHTGILEEKKSGTWHTLCDYRVRNLNSNKNWMQRMSKVRC